MRQQYIDMSKDYRPSRSALDNYTSYYQQYPIQTYYLSFSEAQCNGGSYCGGHEYLYVDTVVSIFRDVRNQYGEAITVTCCYRCPRYNASVSQDANSWHIYGDAFDFDEGTTSQNWDVAQAAASQQVGIAKTKILLYKDNTTNMSLWELETGGYNDTNLPPGWTEYDFGHVTTGSDKSGPG